MARHTAKSHKIRKVEILVIQIQIFETEKSGFEEVLSMKRWLSILAVFGCIVALSGCKNENEKRQAYFNAKVLEINKEYVDVRCIEAFNSGISVDEEFSVTKDVVSAEGVPELNVDDNIRVVFNGDVMESDPLQIGTVYAIYLLDENGEVIPNN